LSRFRFGNRLSVPLFCPATGCLSLCKSGVARDTACRTHSRNKGTDNLSEDHILEDRICTRSRCGGT
jgi:hypothetical protein